MPKNNTNKIIKNSTNINRNWKALEANIEFFRWTSFIIISTPKSFISFEKCWVFTIYNERRETSLNFLDKVYIM